MNFKDIIKSLAPTLGAAIGGPFGGAAVQFAVEKLTGEKIPDSSAGMKVLEQFVLGASPDQLAQLKTIENAFLLKMEELGIRKEELNAQDRDSARKLAISRGMTPQVVMSTIYTTGYFILLYLFLLGDTNIPVGQETLAISLISILAGSQVQIMNFWFGSSSGSKDKTIAGVGK
jgi:hypothetical protein